MSQLKSAEFAWRGVAVPSRQRGFWSLALTFLAVYLPLALGGVLLAVLGLGVDVSMALPGMLLFSTLALFSVLVASYLFARRFADNVDAASDVLWQISTGAFDGRIPTEQRSLIEPLAESVDKMQEYLRARWSELEASRDQIRTVLDSMAEGVIAVDGDQRVLLINEAACRLFRLQHAAAVSRPLWELVRSPQLQWWVGEALGTTEPVGGEMELLVPTSRMLSVRAVGLPASEPGGAIVVASDISQLRRLESVRQEFVANASHELKTPLGSIKACVETLLDGAIDDLEARTRFLQTVGEQSERLDRLVRDMLSLTRIESEGKQADLHPVSLGEIVSVSSGRHRQNAERKKIRLLLEPPSEPVAVLADEESLEQILDNLIDNAVKYTNDGGLVTVRWRKNAEGGVLEVEDTGIGIPPAHLPRIFERFYRVDRARSRELGGTGLGLSIVKHLVQSLEGSVSVSSRLGMGTLFTIQFPGPPPSSFLNNPEQ